MALFDVFKAGKSNKIFDAVWRVVWPQVGSIPDGDEQERRRYLLFLGTILYSTRYNASLAAGMQASSANAAALKVLAGAKYDKDLEDDIVFMFSEAENADYAARLNSLVGSLTRKAGETGRLQTGLWFDSVMEEISGLQQQLAKAPSSES